MREKANYWKYQEVEMLSAVYFTHCFDRHVHEGYAIGAILHGTEDFYARGETHHASTGSLALVNPDEIHDGHAANLEEGWSYRVFYPSIELMQQIGAEIGNGKALTPYFPNSTVYDPYAVELLQRAHISLERSASSLEKDEALRFALWTIIKRHSTQPPQPRHLQREWDAVALVRAHLDRHFAENTSLDDLAKLTGFSPFHLLRLFQQETGLTPYQYQLHRRILNAKRLLANGNPVKEVAYAVGFSDQSHLTRRFKRVVGVTPGQYIRQI